MDVWSVSRPTRGSRSADVGIVMAEAVKMESLTRTDGMIRPPLSRQCESLERHDPRHSFLPPISQSRATPCVNRTKLTQLVGY